MATQKEYNRHYGITGLICDSGAICNQIEMEVFSTKKL